MKIAQLKNFLHRLTVTGEMFCTFRTNDTLFINALSFACVLPCDPKMWAYKKCPEQVLSLYMPFLPDTSRIYSTKGEAEDVPQATCDLLARWEQLNKMLALEPLTPTAYLYESSDTHRVFLSEGGVRYFLNKQWCDCLDPKLLRYTEEFHYQLLADGWIRVLQYVKTTSVRDAWQYAPIAYMDGSVFHSTEEI